MPAALSDEHVAALAEFEPTSRFDADRLLRIPGLGCSRCMAKRRTTYARALTLCGSCARSMQPELYGLLTDEGWVATTGDLCAYLIDKSIRAPFLCFDVPNPENAPGHWLSTIQPLSPSRHRQGYDKSVGWGSAKLSHFYFVPSYLQDMLDVGTLVRRVKALDVQRDIAVAVGGWEGNRLNQADKAPLRRVPVWPTVLQRAVDDEEWRSPLQALLTLLTRPLTTYTHVNVPSVRKDERMHFDIPSWGSATGSNGEETVAACLRIGVAMYEYLAVNAPEVFGDRPQSTRRKGHGVERRQ